MTNVCQTETLMLTADQESATSVIPASVLSEYMV